MKIGIDARAAIWYRGTGIGTYTYQLLRSLYLINRQEFNWRFFWPGDEYRDLDIASDSIFNSIEKNKDKFWEEVHIPARITDEKIDLYHVPQNGIGLPKGNSCPMVVTIHDLIPYIYPETVGKGYLKVFLQEMPGIVARAAHIITVSECSKQDLVRILKVPAEKITVTYEAPEPIYRPVSQKKARAFVGEHYGIQDQYILYIGGFSPRKNVKGLINAFKEIRKDVGYPIKLVLVGKQVREYGDLVVLIEALGLEEDVIWTGFAPVEDLPYLYAAANLFVYPSFYEGFGLPPLEAMACGTPTIAANTSSIPEVVGEGAWLFNPFDSMELAEKMYKLLTDADLRQELGRKGLMRAGEFSWNKTALETMEVYRRVLGKRG
ncbi:Glycosyltransferase involved in cell wall bisynthesis [Carboxydocella thermautotrophica]|nr:Glycosyltransferase involved in cell wall bisynthesis [Carboxydocella thermautotrophica]